MGLRRSPAGIFKCFLKENFGVAEQMGKLQGNIFLGFKYFRLIKIPFGLAHSDFCLETHLPRLLSVGTDAGHP
jgi:hypothetical protein